MRTQLEDMAQRLLASYPFDALADADAAVHLLKPFDDGQVAELEALNKDAARTALEAVCDALAAELALDENNPSRIEKRTRLLDMEATAESWVSLDEWDAKRKRGRRYIKLSICWAALAGASAERFKYSISNKEADR